MSSHSNKRGFSFRCQSVTVWGVLVAWMCVCVRACVCGVLWFVCSCVETNEACTTCESMIFVCLCRIFVDASPVTKVSEGVCVCVLRAVFVVATSDF